MDIPTGAPLNDLQSAKWHGYKPQALGVSFHLCSGESGLPMFSLTSSLSAPRAAPPKLPNISNDAFVFGSAPESAVPVEILSNFSIVTANASQVGLEKYGIDAPDFTFMRTSMDSGRPVDVESLEALNGKRTNHLILIEGRKKKKNTTAERQLQCLKDIGYRYEDLTVMSIAQLAAVINQVTTGSSKNHVRKPLGSTGIRAIAASLYMGASRILISGISFQKNGHNYSNVDLKRKHIDADHGILNEMKSRGLDIFSTDRALSDAVGLQHWPVSGQNSDRVS